MMNYINFIENYLGIPIDDHIEQSFPRVSDNNILDLAQNYRTAKNNLKNPFLCKRSNTSLYRPIIDYKYLYAGVHRSDIPFLYFNRLEDESARQNNIDKICSLLIFSNDIVLRDPLVELLGQFYNGIVDPITSPQEKNRLLNYFILLRDIRSLVMMGKVSFFSGGEADQIRLGADTKREIDNLLNHFNHELFEDTVKNISIQAFLRKLPEINILSDTINADFLFLEGNAMEAYKLWLSYNDKAQFKKNEDIYQQNCTLMNFEFSFFKSNSLHDFANIIQHEDSVNDIRDFFDHVFEEMTTHKDLTRSGSHEGINTLAKEKINKMEKNLITSKFLSRDVSFIRIAKAVVSTGLTMPFDWYEGIREDRALRARMKTIGYVKNLTDKA